MTFLLRAGFNYDEIIEQRRIIVIIRVYQLMN